MSLLAGGRSVLYASLCRKRLGGWYIFYAPSDATGEEWSENGVRKMGRAEWEEDDSGKKVRSMTLIPPPPMILYPK